jgi:hypothetical protein
MAECRRCTEEVDRAFRYCPWCGAPLRMKATELFGGADGKALRVSRYFGDDKQESQVRVSVWSEALGRHLRADAAVSLSEDEAERLAQFLAEVPALDEAQTL